MAGTENNPSQGLEHDHHDDDLLRLLAEDGDDEQGLTAPAEPEPEDDDAEFDMDSHEDEEELVEDDEDEITEPNDDFLSRRFKLKAGDEDIEVTGDELTKGYQRQADYTRKTQQLAEERKAIEAEKAQIAQLQQRYLETLQQQGNSELAKFKDVDWARLRAEDPDEYVMKRAEYQEAQERANKSQVEQRQIMEEQQKQMQAQWAEYVQKQNEELSGPDGIQGWTDPEKGTEIRTALRGYALNLGFTEDEVNQLADAKALKVLDKARRYDELLAKSGKVAQKKKASPPPKVAKAGASGRSGTATKKQAALQRLRRSGSDNDAAAAIFQMLDD